MGTDTFGMPENRTPSRRRFWMISVTAVFLLTVVLLGYVSMRGQSRWNIIRGLPGYCGVKYKSNVPGPVRKLIGEPICHRLFDRPDKLVIRYFEGWNPPVPLKLIGAVEKLDTLNEMVISSAYIPKSQLEQIPAPPNVTRLGMANYLSACSETCMVDADREPPPRPEYAWNGQDMAFLRRFKNLRKLELRALWLRTGVFDVIGDLSQLEILSFRSCDLPSGEELPSLGRLQKLRILTFSGSPTPILDLEWMSDMESLEEFTLASCDRVDESMLRTLAKLPRLKILRLGGGILTKDAASAFGVFPSLRVLNLSGAKMELESLDQLVVPQNLEWLEIDGVQFRPLDSWDEYFEKLGELMKTLPHGCKILLDQQAYQQSQPRLSPNVIYRLTDKPRDEPNEDIMFPDGY